MKKKNIIIITSCVVFVAMVALLIFFNKKIQDDSEPKFFEDCKVKKLELKDGAKYNDHLYTYTYTTLDIEVDGNKSGFAVELTDKDYAGSVTSPSCKTINGAKIVSTLDMFRNSKATSIDISKMDTSSVMIMSGMFADTAAVEIIGLDRLDTSNVVLMNSMFANSKISNLPLKSFNTKKVVNMSDMFNGAAAVEIDVSSFDTSNVILMERMFANTQANQFLLSNFNISKVVSMNGIFDGSQTENAYVGTKEDERKWLDKIYQ